MADSRATLLRVVIHHKTRLQLASEAIRHNSRVDIHRMRGIHHSLDMASRDMASRDMVNLAISNRVDIRHNRAMDNRTHMAVITSMAKRTQK